MSSCPCESGLPHAQCCQPLLMGERYADTAEALMRSRYSAFVAEDESYLLNTWALESRPSTLGFDANQRWLGLKIIAREAGGPDDATGMVEFVARYKIQGSGFRLHERSRFLRRGGRWFYLDGDLITRPKSRSR